MTSTVTSTVFELNPNSIWLEISETIQNEAWEESATFAKISESSRQLAYINLLSQKLILPYLQEEVPTATIEDNQASFWQSGINGSVIKLDNQRLILIPSEAIDLDELRIPEEWVNSPDLVAHYYLAVQVDTEENLLRIWGYTTNDNLREQATYTRRDRSYSLDRENITEDVDSLWLIREYFKCMRQRLEQLFDNTWKTPNKKLVSIRSSASCINPNQYQDSTGMANLKKEKKIKLNDYKLDLVIEGKLTNNQPDTVKFKLTLFPLSRILPANLKLSFISPSGKELRSIQSRESDNRLSLNFLIPLNKLEQLRQNKLSYKIIVTLEKYSVTVLFPS